MEISALHGNWVDLIAILMIILYLVGGWRRGFILGLVDLVGFVVSFAFALKTYAFVGQILVANFQIPPGIGKAVGFLFSGLVIEFVLSIVINFIYRYLHRRYFIAWANLERRNILTFLKSLDRFFGFLPAVGEALIFTAFMLTLLIALPIAGVIKKDILSAKIGGALVVRTQNIEKELDQIFGEAVNESLNFLTVNANPQSNEKIDLKFTQTEVKEDLASEEAMLRLINQDRAKIDLSPLSFSLTLRALARSYAEDMFARGYFSHNDPQGQTPFDRMRKSGIEFYAAGENLALAPNVELAHQGLMNSPGHRANILSSDFGQVGIGVIDGGIYGLMFVQEFTN
ncbi:CvpA family protein [Candidatus Microgenomates bacterium]|nr:CvpA family protein [Candidatus Microgenomates bacterium]